jgi:hypothetical protein
MKNCGFNRCLSRGIRSLLPQTGVPLTSRSDYKYEKTIYFQNL